ncbi:MAG: exodeoxyribonuclease beta subunit [Frankiales bacterium]|nr:exodeoxyribonuclease beta subunit [Frankiales bacterium]
MRLDGPLPTGTSVLEASAGTGKTWTIAGLVCRYVAEGHATIDQLLVVTFGRAATSELRTRVRERLLSVHEGLGAPSADPVVQLLSGSDVELHRHRLATALASFDSATVATTHGFCEQVLRSLGTLSDLDPGTQLVENLDDLISEVVDDLYLRFSGLGNALLPFDRSAAMSIAKRAVYDPDATLHPLGADQDSPGDLRVRFCTKVREEVEARKRRMRVLGYDDQLGRVRAALCDPITGPAACERLRARFSVVLVDEFQDTDPVQWDVLQTAFHGHRTLVVIGDPKQAIYAFRGADVNAYLEARKVADVRESLDTNWRSDTGVLEGLKVLLRGAALGHPEIVVGEVKAGHAEIAVTPEGPAVRLRAFPRSHLPGSARSMPLVGAVREHVARDVASEVVQLLQQDLHYSPRFTSTPRPLTARDIAVLVRTGTQAQLVRDALLAVDVPSVLSGTTSVFTTSAAKDWVVFLEALEQPHNRGRVRRLALTSLIGRRAQELDGDAGVGAADDLAQQLRTWVDVLGERGVAGLYAVVSEQTQLADRLLRLDEGERLLTDLRHVAEIVHGQGVEAQLGLAGLVSWLRERVADTGDLDQERSRRLDTERAAVQVVTVHTSKGLEFPVVLVPFGWDESGGGTAERQPRGHDGDGRRTLFVGGKKDGGYDAACAGEDTESAGEELRLLYVAMTRAISRLVLWWAPSKKTPGSPLHRLLFCTDPADIPEDVPVPAEEAALAQLHLIAGTAVQVETASNVVLTPMPFVPPDVADLRLADFARSVDLTWRRTSYSGLTRDAHDAGPAVGSEPELEAKDDEPTVVAAGIDATAVPSPMGELPGGAAFGTLVHEVLEEADLSAPSLVDELVRAGAGLELAEALLPAVSTPLGPGGLALKDIPRAEQLRELDFEMPLAGGDEPVAEVRLGDVSELLRTHLPEGDPVRAYADVLDAAAMSETLLRGYLGGSIDVVLRVDGRYSVVDHKTNRLAPRDVPLTAWHYRREALDDAMLEAHYPLQALLYCVALHRYLRWRLPDYQPDRHLGPVRYLFLRGMVGPGSDTGVWSWQPAPGLVPALSDLLAGDG